MSRTFLLFLHFFNNLTYRRRLFWRFSTKEQYFGYKVVKSPTSLTHLSETSIIIYAHAVQICVQYPKGVFLCQI